MRSVLVAAMMARMAAAGGAGAGVEAEAQFVRAGDTWEDVRKHFSALRSEVSTLEAEYQSALERRRKEALRQAEETEFARRGR